MRRTFSQAFVVGFINNPITQVYLSRVVPHIGSAFLLNSKIATVSNYAKNNPSVCDSLVKTACHALAMGPIQIPTFLFFSNFAKNFSV